MSKAIATKSKTDEILKKFNLHAKKGYGQNFIIDPSIVEKIASLCEGHEGCAIEIGPGIGALTQQLAHVCKKVIAIEIDKSLIDVLKYSLEDEKNVEIINEDFLDFDFEKLVDELRQTYSKVVICANLPYYITTPILFKIFESNCKLDAITVMMQKEVAERFNAKPRSKDYNALSIITQYRYDTSILLKIPRTIFNPVPNVDSSVIQFKEKNEKLPYDDPQPFFEFVQLCFKQRRKLLTRNLKDAGYASAKVAAALTECSISELARGEELTLTEFERLYNTITK